MCTSRCQCRRRRRRPPRRGHAGGVAWRSDQSRLSVGRHAALRSGPGHEFDSIKCALPAGPGTLGPCPAPARLRPGAARSAAAMASVRAVSAARLRLSAVGGQAALESEAAACQGPGAIKAAVAAKALPSSATESMRHGVHASKSESEPLARSTPGRPAVVSYARRLAMLGKEGGLGGAGAKARPGTRAARLPGRGPPASPCLPAPESTRTSDPDRLCSTAGFPAAQRRWAGRRCRRRGLDARRRGVARRRRRLSGGGADPPRGPLTKDGAR